MSNYFTFGERGNGTPTTGSLGRRRERVSRADRISRRKNYRRPTRKNVPGTIFFYRTKPYAFPVPRSGSQSTIHVPSPVFDFQCILNDGGDAKNNTIPLPIHPAVAVTAPPRAGFMHYLCARLGDIRSRIAPADITARNVIPLRAPAYVCMSTYCISAGRSRLPAGKIDVDTFRCPRKKERHVDTSPTTNADCSGRYRGRSEYRRGGGGMLLYGRKNDHHVVRFGT